MIVWIGQDREGDSEAGRRSVLWNRLGRIVGSFRMNIGTKCFEQGLHVRFVKKHDVVDRPQSSNELRAGLLIEDWAAGALERANAAIHGDGDDKNGAMTASSFQLAEVTAVYLGAAA